MHFLKVDVTHMIMIMIMLLGQTDMTLILPRPKLNISLQHITNSYMISYNNYISNQATLSDSVVTDMEIRVATMHALRENLHVVV